jgi:hypothetical protein
MQYLALTSSSGITFSSQQVPNGPPAPAFDNAFTVAITAAQTLTLPNNGILYYDFFIDYPAGTHQCYLAGDLFVVTTVTR